MSVGKKKTSATGIPTSRPRKLKVGTGLSEWDPNEALLDRDHIGRALSECLKENDIKGFVEIIKIYLSALRRASSGSRRGAGEGSGRRPRR
jgi:hypothetical protein